MFSVTEALDNLGTAYRSGPWPSPYRARWASAQPRAVAAVLDGHQGEVWSVCPVTVDGRNLLATAGHDGTVRVWDPSTGQQAAVLDGHQGAVWWVCPVTVDGRNRLACSGDDRHCRTAPRSSSAAVAARCGYGG